MSFKIGDKVKIINDGGDGHKGEIGIVHLILDKFMLYPIEVELENDLGVYEPEDLELFTETT